MTFIHLYLNIMNDWQSLIMDEPRSDPEVKIFQVAIPSVGNNPCSAVVTKHEGQIEDVGFHLICGPSCPRV